MLTTAKISEHVQIHRGNGNGFWTEIRRRIIRARAHNITGTDDGSINRSGGSGQYRHVQPLSYRELKSLYENKNKKKKQIMYHAATVSAGITDELTDRPRNRHNTDNNDMAEIL